MKKWALSVLIAVSLAGVSSTLGFGAVERLSHLPVMKEVIPLVRDMPGLGFLSIIAMTALAFWGLFHLVFAGADEMERQELWRPIGNLLSGKRPSRVRRELTAMLEISENEGHLHKAAIQSMRDRYFRNKKKGSLRITEYLSLISKFGSRSAQGLFHQLISAHCYLSPDSELTHLGPNWEITDASEDYLAQYCNAVSFRLDLQLELGLPITLRAVAVPEIESVMKEREMMCLVRAVNETSWYVLSLSTGWKSENCMHRMEQRIRELHSLPGTHPTQSELMEFALNRSQ